MERVTLAQCPNCHAVSRTDEHVHKAGCAIQHQAEERTAVWLDEVVAMVEGAAEQLADLLNSPAATNPTPEGPKPTGTIFELDLYAREGLARLADQYESATETVSIPRRQVIGMIHAISDELKIRIDNCMKQYAVPEGHVAVYLPVEVAEEITRPVIAANLNGELDHAHQLVEATRQALNREGDAS